ncbi:gamma tubulin complex Spc97/GCP2 subunit Alp4 [Vanrija albida]|uniref:Spindle pole body component n=1 Tax=Vanrija albida TaxID=181172 RepID=A0ABR3Q9H9_9TREE
MASSRTAAGSSRVPFTPRPSRRTTSGHLTKHEFNQVAGTLASVRRVPREDIFEELDLSGEAGAILRERDPQPVFERRQPARPASEQRERERPTSHTSVRRVAETAPSSSRASSSLSTRREREYGHGHTHARSRDSRDGKVLERNVDIEVVVRNDVPVPDTPQPAAERKLLDGVPLDVQEAWICEDMLFVLQGVEGSLIRYAEDYDPLDADQRLRGARWRIDPSLDPSLLSLINRLLPLATFFTSVEASIEIRNSPECGMVSHALGSGIRGMLKEYRVLTAQLESLFLTSATFTLQTLYFHLHPTLHTMSLLSSLCLALEADETAAGDASDLSDDDDDDELDGKAEELGLGGAGLKGLMKNIRAQKGLSASGPVVGGEVLGIICEREATMSGDPTATTLHSQLLVHASQPYCRMLLQWIQTGYLSDPFEEFMVKESGYINKGVLESDYTDEYWDRRYTLRDGSSLAASKGPSLTSAVPPPRAGTNRLPGGACIPSFLQPWKHKILLAGKYLNVMRECGIEVKKPGEVDTDGDKDIVMNETKFYKRIEDAYIYANQSLLRLLVEEQELIPHLRSLKHFFFADQSDFLTNFLDLASADLTRKPAKSVSIQKLQSLLDLAVRNPASSSSNDPYKDNLKVTMASQNLYDWLLKIVSHHGSMTEGGDIDFGMDFALDSAPKKDGDTLVGIDALAFDYTVKFPLSLVISRKAITRYQLIFRFLVHLHHLESALSAMWLEHKAPMWRDSTGNADMDQWKARVFALRARMLAFVRQILAYATGEVLESNWRALEAKLANVGTVDQLMRDHVDFLDTCLKQCMLTNSKLLSVYSKLMKTMSAFVSYQDSFNKVLQRFKADPLTESDAAKAAHRWNVINKFEINYNHHSNLHLDAVTYNAGSENVVLLALVTRLHQTTLRS